ncbi:MAG: type II secretion system major pseudopilin GspG [Candidatus Omnitrophica bacterium]|nr:type II secretion system major pseudopilin GspG [Candidatus Omnitrophota bacterium]
MVKERAGFTLIELLVVVIILGVLVSLVVPRLAGRTEEARRQAAKADIEGGIALALDLYEADIGKYPSSLEDLLRNPGEDEWRGPYLKKGLPKDPWGQPYIYHVPGAYNQETYDLFSASSDKQEGTQDDIVNWQTT